LQMYTPWPAMTLATWSCGLPKKLHFTPSDEVFFLR
jgi:hypothetical protein